MSIYFPNELNPHSAAVRMPPKNLLNLVLSLQNHSFGTSIADFKVL
ncbi:hypothetical protein GMES_0193 [Paraglaciecola mesophila KMM 241]|uniref:Uncharacterized protein n=1 Tax=Paraglaciecola mesophila KMM 241 TaxID=1128912 RepID=K6Z0I0_9ALTE|nr:hypothetical protein GMES_0193 [Paraglaciecola mesophila KMM 241]